jgi:hypothetical protein
MFSTAHPSFYATKDGNGSGSKREHVAEPPGIGAGRPLDFPEAPAKQVLAIATSASTSAAVVATFNATTFAKVDPPPPLVPPGDRQQQG